MRSFTALLLAGAALAAGDASAAPSGGWVLTAYYTPVEATYPMTTTEHLAMCPIAPTDPNNYNINVDLGYHDSTFIDDVVGRTGTAARGLGALGAGAGWGKLNQPYGPHGDQYIGWNQSGNCFWLSDKPRDATSQPLVPLQQSSPDHPATMANDGSVLPMNSIVTVTGCGYDVTPQAPIDPATCQKIKNATFKITDNGPTSQWLDMYIGEQPLNMTRDDMYGTSNATNPSEFAHLFCYATVDSLSAPLRPVDPSYPASQGCQ